MYAPPHSRPSCARSVKAAMGREQVCTLKLNLVLYNKSLAFVVDLGGKFGGDGMMSSRVLHDKTFVALHASVDSWLLYGPLSNVRPILVALGVLLLGMRRCPSRLPVVSELFEEGRFQSGGLQGRLANSEWGQECVELPGQSSTDVPVKATDCKGRLRNCSCRRLQRLLCLFLRRDSSS